MGMRESLGRNGVGNGIAGWMSRYFGGRKRRSGDLALAARASEGASGPFGVWPGEDDGEFDGQYANYFFTSVPVYAAVKLRADAVSRPELRVYRVSSVDGRARREWVGREHPAQALLDRVNPHWTGGDLWRATETYLNLWGEAYWAVERDEAGTPFELWPLRPDRCGWFRMRMSISGGMSIRGRRGILWRSRRMRWFGCGISIRWMSTRGCRL